MLGKCGSHAGETTPRWYPCVREPCGQLGSLFGRAGTRTRVVDPSMVPAAPPEDRAARRRGRWRGAACGPAGSGCPHPPETMVWARGQWDLRRGNPACCRTSVLRRPRRQPQRARVKTTSPPLRGVRQAGDRSSDLLAPHGPMRAAYSSRDASACASARGVAAAPRPFPRPFPRPCPFAPLEEPFPAPPPLPRCRA